MLLFAFSACKPTGDADPSAATAAAEPPPVCGDEGHLETALYGAIETALDWRSGELECTGMPRPDGRGARLRFAGPAGEDGQLAIIIAIPDLSREIVTAEYSSNVTLIEEGNGRFFSTPDLNNCLADVRSVSATDDSGDRFVISGSLYCVSPLPEVNGNSSVSIPELNFRGLLDWTAS